MAMPRIDCGLFRSFVRSSTSSLAILLNIISHTETDFEQILVLITLKRNVMFAPSDLFAVTKNEREVITFARWSLLCRRRERERRLRDNHVMWRQARGLPGSCL